MKKVLLFCCPLCGRITRKSIGGDDKDWAVLQEFGGGRHLKTIRRYKGSDLASKGHWWYNEVKRVIGKLAYQLGLVQIKEVIREVVPAVVQKQIMLLHERIKHLLKIIKSQSEEIKRLRIKLKSISRVEYDYSTPVEPKVSFRIQGLEEVEGKWQK